MKVRTRFAPSPTGFLHVGGLRTAIYAYSFAKKHNGEFVLRVENTDQKRFVESSIEEIFEMLNEFGLTPDEGPMQGGKFAPYIQSERLSIYEEYAKKLVEKNGAYYCFLTLQEEESLRKELELEKKVFRSPHRNFSAKEVQSFLEKKIPYVIRLKVPENEKIEFVDGLSGRTVVDSNTIEDAVLLKSDGFPTYHLAAMVDDHIMEITHIVRGHEWKPSTPKHVLIYKFFGWVMPEIYHPSVILDPDGGKLSKRKGNVSVKQFLVEGYLKEALINFIILVGWSDPTPRAHGEKERELYSLEEFAALFDLKDMSNSNGVFNREKLLWFNQQYIIKKSAPELTQILIDWVKRFADDKSLLEFLENDLNLNKKIALVQERSQTLIEILNNIKFFYIPPTNVEWEIEQTKKYFDKIPEIKKAIVDQIKLMDDDSSKWNQEEWVSKMKGISTQFGIKPGDSFMVLRLAVVGSAFSPPLFEAIQIMGKLELIERID